MLFDSHAHLMSPEYQKDWDQVLQDVLDNLDLVMNVGCNERGIGIAIEMAEQYPQLYAAVSLHPNDANDYTEQLWQYIEESALHPKVRAIGETGLDYHWKDATPQQQKTLFHQHIDLARRVGKPLIIHDREAHRDTLDELQAANAQDVGGIFHAYSGSVEMAREVLDMNFYIALGGTLTFKNANKLLDVAKYVPLDRLLIETDCPYLTPVPFRGKRNHPMYVRYVAEKIAELRGMTYEEVANATYENGKRVFGIA